MSSVVSSNGANCPGCGHPRVIREGRTGELVCPHCGLVLEAQPIDMGPSFSRANVLPSGPQGHGPAQAPFSPRKRTDTVFPWNRDAQGNVLPPAAQREFRLLRRRAREGSSRVHARPGMSPKGEEIVRRLSVSLGLPPLVQDAALLVLAKGGEARLFRGRSAAAAAGASVYAACRRYSLPRTWSEVADASGITRAEFGRAYMALRRGLNLELPPVGLGTYVRRFSTELKLSSQTLGKALSILDGVGDHPDTCGVSPNGLAGAALYLASVQCGEPRRQSDIARVSQVTDVTLRHAFRRLGRIISGKE